jgi:GH25 family lysozyme M1 (1,4-beta-N-acetylmuramidase)
MSDKVLGLDLNDYRKGVPLKTAKSQGVRFVLNKATQGATIVHETNEIYRRECKALGLAFGNYMYWKFANDAVRQVNHYLEHMGEVQFPPIFDVERIGNRKPGTNLPLVSVQANRNHLKVCLDHCEEKLGLKPMIYTNWATWRHLFADWDLILDYPLWVANWRLYGEPLLPVPAVNYVIHQFTSNYKVAGYYKGVDANWFNGSEAAFEKYIMPEKKQFFVTVDVAKGGDSNLFLLGKGDSVKVEVQEL